MSHGGTCLLVREAPFRDLLHDIKNGPGAELDGLKNQGEAGSLVSLLEDFDGDGTGDLLIASFQGYCESRNTSGTSSGWSRGRVSWSPAKARVESYPLNGSTAGGNTVILLGGGLGQAPAVSFGNRAANEVQLLGDGILIASAPPRDAPGTAQVTVETARAGAMASSTTATTSRTWSRCRRRAGWPSAMRRRRTTTRREWEPATSMGMG